MCVVKDLRKGSSIFKQVFRSLKFHVLRNKHLQMEYIERVGLIVMITTGESILALIVADFEQTLEHYAIVLIAFFTMFLLKSIYFESHSETPDMHALAEVSRTNNEVF